MSPSRSAACKATAPMSASLAATRLAGSRKTTYGIPSQRKKIPGPARTSILRAVRALVEELAVSSGDRRVVRHVGAAGIGLAHGDARRQVSAEHAVAPRAGGGRGARLTAECVAALRRRGVGTVQ
eukprot:gene1721-biopygen13919